MGFKDQVGFTDGVSAGLESAPTPPAVPCPECGAETKEHHPIKDDTGKVVTKQRICSNRDCREVIQLS